jgi:hypothetical protein
MTRIPAWRAAWTSLALRVSKASFSVATISTMAVWKSMTTNAAVLGSTVNWLMVTLSVFLGRHW